ncbi:DUF2283 domain-containing protein [Priestia aryabhattai]
MKRFLKHITYNKDSGMAYIYLADPLKYKIMSTEELEQNDDIMIDLGEECPVVGIELEGKAAAKIASLTTYPKYEKVVEKDGSVSYLLKLSDKKTKKEIQYPGIGDVSFLFGDLKCNDFIGVSITENKWYSEKHFLNNKS